MTLEPTQSVIPVTQADRTLAALLLNEKGSYRAADLVLHGNMDSHPLVERLARHRLQARKEGEAQGMEKAAGIATRRADNLAHEPRAEFDDHQQFAAGREHEARCLAAAIREASHDQ